MLRSWVVDVRKPYLWHSVKRVYVVARSQRSAKYQAKRFVGYTEDNAKRHAGVVCVQELEVLER